AQVVKAYVEKQRRVPSKMAKATDKIEVGAAWNTADSNDESISAGHFLLQVPTTRLPLATAAPGLQYGKRRSRIESRSKVNRAPALTDTQDLTSTASGQRRKADD